MTIEKIIDVSKNIVKEYLDEAEKKFLTSWVNNYGVGGVGIYPKVTVENTCATDEDNFRITFEYSNFFITILTKYNLVVAKLSDFWSVGASSHDLRALADMCDLIKNALKSEE